MLANCCIALALLLQTGGGARLSAAFPSTDSEPLTLQATDTALPPETGTPTPGPADRSTPSPVPSPADSATPEPPGAEGAPTPTGAPPAETADPSPTPTLPAPSETPPAPSPPASLPAESPTPAATATRGGATVVLTYDLAGRKLTMDDPDMGDWVYTYDALGNLKTQTDARGCVATLSYDGLNRLTDKVFSGSCNSTVDIAYDYDAFVDGSNYGRGYRTGMTDASGSATWKYDTRGRVTEESKVVTGAASPSRPSGATTPPTWSPG